MSADALEDDFELQEFPEDSEIVASEHIDVISDQELLSYEVPEPISVTKKRPASEQQVISKNISTKLRNLNFFQRRIQTKRKSQRNQRNRVDMNW